MLTEVEEKVSTDVKDSPVGEAAGGEAALSKRVALLMLFGLSAIYLVSIFIKPAGDPYGNYFTLCGFKNLTGLPCPGCGLTHSFCAIGGGDLSSAFAFNLLGPPLFLLSVFFWVRSIAVLRGWGRFALFLDRMLTAFRPVRAFGIAFALFGVARIVYVLAYRPGAFDVSPLARLVADIFR